MLMRLLQLIHAGPRPAAIILSRYDMSLLKNALATSPQYHLMITDAGVLFENVPIAQADVMKSVVVFQDAQLGPVLQLLF